MPELPEVETIRRQLTAEVIGKKIIDVWTDTEKMIVPDIVTFKLAVLNKSIEEISRRAKLLILRLEGKTYIAAHLKLNGRLLLRKKDYNGDGYIRIKLVLEDDLELRLGDSRKFAYMQVFNNPKELASVIDRYGREPLDDLDIGSFREIVKVSRKRIKDLLLDQSKISGIGNIYANDSLWLAKIHPQTTAGKLTNQEIDDLYKSIESILREALADGGASDQWYRQLHGETGNYQNHFKVYRRAGQPCLRHPNARIQ